MMRPNSTANSSSSAAADDDELTNLTWLQDNNLLQNMTHNESDESTSSEASHGGGCKEDNENLSPKSASVKATESKRIESNLLTTSSGVTIPRSVAPVRYDPLFHTQTKPPYSFSSLIFMAIESSPVKALPVKDIYGWIAKNFPYYKVAPDGWKNTVRHNLSLNKCFRKIEKGKRAKDSDQDHQQLDDQLASKGSLWCVDPELRPNLLQSIKKTPAHIYPYMSTAKTGTNLVQISNIINSTSDNQPNGNRTSQIVGNASVTIGNHNNISPSNNFVNQSPGNKIIALEKVPQKNILTTAKRVLIPITKKVGREPEEADAAESMLTLTQCSTAGSLNNGNIYIITNKGENFLPTFQLNAKPTIITGSPIKPQQTSVKNQITILTQPTIIQTAGTSTSAGGGGGTIAFATKPVAGVASKLTPTIKNATVIPVSASQLISNNAPTDHNYFNRSSAIKTINNVITIPASSLTSVAGQPILVNSSQTASKSSPLIISSSNIKTVGNNRIITITANPSSVRQNIVIKSPPPAKPDAGERQPAAEKCKPPPSKKAKVVEDEDGLKCAEALFNLANGTVKLAKSNSAAEKKTADARAEKKDQPAAGGGKSKTATIQSVSTSSSTITRSTAKKLKASI